jgi:hypothetical protein
MREREHKEIVNKNNGSRRKQPYSMVKVKVNSSLTTPLRQIGGLVAYFYTISVLARVGSEW